MENSSQIFRDGISQQNRSQRALAADYVAVDERFWADWLQFAQDYAKELQYYDESNQPNGDWSPFFAGDIPTMLAYMEHPEKFANKPEQLRKLAQPHLALFFTFLHLLRYPQQQFRELTQRYLDFYYKQVLKLPKKGETPDQVHVIFELAPTITTHQLKAGTFLNAGVDSQGNDLHYATDEKIIVNQAKIASVKTLYLEKIDINLSTIHNDYDRSDEAFEQVLRWAVGHPEPGDALPAYVNEQGMGRTVDIAYLKEIYQAIKDQEIEEIDPNYKNYILNQLYFATIDDFKNSFTIHDQEIKSQQGDEETDTPTELQWNSVYELIEKAYRKKINRERRDTLKRKREAFGFQEMFQFALGEPNPGDRLPPMPNGYTTLEELYQHRDEGSVQRYVQNELYLSISDFQKIMDNRNQDNPDWQEVYRLLETAQTQKRQFSYPPIGRKEIKSIHGTSIVEAKNQEIANLPRFKTFSPKPQTQAASVTTAVSQPLGFAIASPLLVLQEGERTLTLTLACETDTLNLNEIVRRQLQPFEIELSSGDQWFKPPSVQFKVGDFILEPPLQNYSSNHLSLIGEVTGNDGLTQDEYIQLKDGTIYQITAVDSQRVQLQSVGRIPQSGSGKKYATLSLAGQSESLTEVSLSEDNSVITAEQSQFSPMDIHQFIVWSDGRIYEIKNVINAGRVEVQVWGFIPGNDIIRKYERIELENPSPLESNIKITRISINEAADNTVADHGFTGEDSEKLLVWTNGNVFKIGNIGENEAEIESIGTIPFDQVLGDTINLYRPSAIYLNSLQFHVTLDANQPAVTPPQQASRVGIDTSYPVIKILLRSTNQDDYQQLKSIGLNKISLRVDVAGIKTLQLRNDSTVLSPKSPFSPFDTRPKVGSGFYIANPEISRKKLDRLTIQMEWMGLPQDFGTHYQAYTETGVMQAIQNDSFKAKLKLFTNRSFIDIEENSKPIFADGENGLSNLIRLSYGNFQFPGYLTDPYVATTATDDPVEMRRYFKLELEPIDFAHDLYPVVLNKVALSAQDKTVYSPYTPEVKTISLDYTASMEMNLNDSPIESSQSCLMHLHPFGYVDILAMNQEGTFNHPYYLLPQYDQEGYLYIGLRHLHPPQDVSLLFQLIPGSGDAELKPSQIDWSYLSQDRWWDFKPTEILSDSTNGLVDSGIIRLSIPETATDQNHRLPSNLYWLRASVKENATAIPDILNIQTQAVRATFVNQNNAADHLKQPLAANSITQLVLRDPAIKTVKQPYSSFGGKMQEDSHAFRIRVSERLRHKQRALTAWDYERLVLDHFRQIYKVKCITQSVQSQNPSAATVTVVVIPDISHTAPFFPLEPKAPLYLLKEIEAYLNAQTSPFVKLIVKNPRYEQIKYRVGIRLRPGYESGYYRKQLNQDIQRFLSPWAYEKQADIPFGSSIHSSAVIHFIEQRPYIDYVTNLKLIEQIEIQGSGSGESNVYYQINASNLAQVRHPDSILVSAPDHIIDLISTDRYGQDYFEGIGYMMIGIDFLVF